MPQTAHYSFAYHQMLVVFAGTVCLFGTWVGMRHFARALATAGSIRYGWRFMASVGTGAALWASTFIFSRSTRRYQADSSRSRPGSFSSSPWLPA